MTPVHVKQPSQILKIKKFSTLKFFPPLPSSVPRHGKMRVKK